MWSFLSWVRHPPSVLFKVLLVLGCCFLLSPVLWISVVPWCPAVLVRGQVRFRRVSFEAAPARIPWIISPAAFEVFIVLRTFRVTTPFSFYQSKYVLVLRGFRVFSIVLLSIFSRITSGDPGFLSHWIGSVMLSHITPQLERSSMHGNTSAMENVLSIVFEISSNYHVKFRRRLRKFAAPPKESLFPSWFSPALNRSLLTWLKCCDSL